MAEPSTMVAEPHGQPQIPYHDSAELHAAHVAHQFDDAEQQKEAVTLGMWLFLAQEVMFFGGMFLGYTVYRSMYYGPLAEASHHLDIWLGALNTGVLLCSSLTMALAVRAAQTDERQKLQRYLLLTMALGTVFLIVKAFEYSHKFEQGLIPGVHFSLEGVTQRPQQIFYSFYFAMTGMHALHMVIGIVLMGVIYWMARRGRYSSAYYNPVEMSGLYWHFVDIVWIFLFPLLYLIQR
jgi:cytochrome c oxidase subunit 3